MTANRTASALVAFLLLLCAACAPAISRQLRDEAGTPPPFQDLVAHPEEYQGRVVILGGYILEIQNEPRGSVLTVLQAPLGWWNKPKIRDLSEGRFIVTTDTVLDPNDYARDRQLTVGGRVAGVRDQALGDTTYRYPVIEAQELHLWPQEVYQGPSPDYPFYDPWSPWKDPWDPMGYR